MAHKELKEQAIKMRLNGMSYSQIKAQIPVSKSTLSLWLDKYPLAPERLRELRDFSPRRIESYRATMKKKRDARIAVHEARVVNDLGKLSKRELFVAGFFLFWGEGSKARRSEVSLANTDPTVIECFIQWLVLLGASKEKIRFTLHLYKDMKIKKELNFWSKTLGFPPSAFYKPYIKKTKFSAITYKNGFGHGTCNVRYMNQDLNDYVLMGLKQIRGLYEAK
ncbi:MAG: hypothetical protein A3C93_01865 [Candidatus Lloydbacteria bacterium RIFCSPHIGHO2_02_FULL_54_17]|uniref:Uncharacterized protein n=1 Tax=Candidatus Lloydbacteria bacterium RIFCSPHIGHO2_02_FULL_54_17 TaxID=1798664 RepID=A0A1G2DL06_9BACT|nr:MAG: hypothetical protein A2762_03035 [Candidatus Lloydbacteria bacterium RIFCSPHIGHO2_01_FULL_54_11]OGZ13488.1 MAG: hypothetical protein A3C93_01865 [Candidatus Lloydbacteria bacterium RIFCSPHIGHO2_02_FULL_54_17]OGZ14244.1 MAG: hypothetical protein A3H76_05695 [Candidatus Lloydbacteria bacterium RIFCSPLOWO2_02_FULL_54_12]OGZ15329.1 MAG: hypothetical protein A2948_05940 [Candidatus Lloydbacteria bacterium RIFCSPLOWO2_01_FULL_54_18]